MDFINWLQQQQKMYDPHVNAQNLLGGVSTAVSNSVDQQANTPGGYVPGGADLTGNTQALIDPDKLNPGGYSDNTLPPLQQTTPETNTYGVADLTNDYTHDLTKPVVEPKPVTPQSPPNTPNATTSRHIPGLLQTDYAFNSLLDQFKGNRDMALIAQQMSPELVNALLSQYGVQWKDYLSDHLKQFLKDNNAW